MNICTYVTAVSIKPKMYAIAIEHGTKTHHNLLGNGRCVLQLLQTHHISLINKLGAQSGFEKDKQAMLKAAHQLHNWSGLQMLHDAAAYVLLQAKGKVTTGDHDLFYFDVLKSKTNTEENLLRWDTLVHAGIIL
jgi:flavin reductase (DIM6/NTAB) family NADH-FMN oxidoreductase RutF